MSFDAARQAIETRFMAQWQTGSPLQLRTPVGFDRHEFAPPTDEASVRLTILPGDSFNASMGDPGSNLVRYSGVVMFQIFTPGGAGSKAAYDIADLIRPIFTNWRSGDGSVLFGTAAIGPIVEDPPFLMVPVSFPFTRDEFHG